MEQHTNQGRKLVALILASGILIVGLIAGGAIIIRNTRSENGTQAESAGLDSRAYQGDAQPQSPARQAPGCGI